jgi:hypothetical protein
MQLFQVVRHHGQRATLVPLARRITTARGRVVFVLHSTSGARLTLKARMAGRDYVEHLSAPVTVRVD